MAASCSCGSPPLSLPITVRDGSDMICFARRRGHCVWNASGVGCASCCVFALETRRVEELRSDVVSLGSKERQRFVDDGEKHVLSGRLLCFFDQSLLTVA